MEPHDYWIGDRVRVHSENTEGIYEGDKDGMALIKVNSNHKLFPYSDITIMEEADDFDLGDIDNESKPMPFTLWDSTIDLHIEALNPAMVSAEPAAILAHQVSRTKDFIAFAIARKAREVTIIHGKGEGVLRTEVLAVLSRLSEVSEVRDINDGGSVVVKFKV